jgi:energy-converting hydrogenase Eha subunit E
LRSTIYAAVEPASALAMREIVAIGVALAVAAWVAVLALVDPASVARTFAGLDAALRSPAAVQDAAWLAAGAAVAVVATAAQGIRFPGPARRNRA